MASEKVTIDLVFGCETIEHLKKACDVAQVLVQKYPDEPKFDELYAHIVDAIEASTVEDGDSCSSDSINRSADEIQPRDPTGE